jgi:hypothetical protein
MFNPKLTFNQLENEGPRSIPSNIYSKPAGRETFVNNFSLNRLAPKNPTTRTIKKIKRGDIALSYYSEKSPVNLTKKVVFSE